MKSDLRKLCLGVLVCLTAWAVVAQQSATAPAPSAASTVPNLINYSGTLTDLNGKALNGVTGVTFLLYKDQQGGPPLWLETQNVTLGRNGQYTVTLGATTSQGLPADVFATGEARWLAVQVAGQQEQPRVLLVAVPYALKAGDAQTIGGLPASAFVLAAPTNVGGNATSPTGSVAASSTSTSAPPPSSDVTTTGGTVHAVPLWTTATNIQSSVITQTGSGASAKVGINTTTPMATLDVKGATIIRGLLSLPPTVPATAASGAISQPENMAASSFNSSTHAPVNQTFQWKAEPVGNNTTSPSATLNLLFGSGVAPAETGFHIAGNGRITFASGQTFPGTGNGTVTSVGSGTGLTGGPITGSGTLSLAPAACAAGNALSALPFTCSPFATLGANAFIGNQSVTGNVTVSGFVGVGTQNPTYQLEVDATSAANGAVHAVGFSAPQFSGNGGSDGIDSLGGDGDFQSDQSGGIGLNATGGFGTGGGAGVAGFGGSGTKQDAVGGFFSGANTIFGGDGVYGSAGSGYAGNFAGDLNVSGAIFAFTKDFKIDHPLDPANKYLVHASVESSEMMNIYTGNVTTDAQGEATVQLPEWFEVLNTDFRYQLTVIGQFAQAIVGRKIQDHQFLIRTSGPNVEVSWQVTGIRHDAYAKAHPLVVEEEKDARLRSFYLSPEFYGAPPEKQIEWARHPQMMKKIKEHREMQARLRAAAKPN